MNGNTAIWGKLLRKVFPKPLSNLFITWGGEFCGVRNCRGFAPVQSTRGKLAPKRANLPGHGQDVPGASCSGSWGKPFEERLFPKPHSKPFFTFWARFAESATRCRSLRTPQTVALINVAGVVPPPAFLTAQSKPARAGRPGPTSQANLILNRRPRRFRMVKGESVG